MIITRKRFEEEINKAVIEDQARRYEQRRIEALEKRVNQLESEIYEMRMRTDPVFRARHTPVCNPIGDVNLSDG